MSHELFYFIGNDEKYPPKDWPIAAKVWTPQSDFWPPSVTMHLPFIDGYGKIQDPLIPGEGRVIGLHAAQIYELALRTKPKNIIEIGRRAGYSTRILLDVCLKTGAHLWSIDKIPSDILGDIKPETHQYYHQLEGDGTKYPFPEKAEFIFIDTWHTYDATLEEMDAMWPMLNDPGVMAVFKTDSHFPCKKAVLDWAEKNKIGYINDSRHEGISLFIKPCYSLFSRDRSTPDKLSNEDFPKLV